MDNDTTNNLSTAFPVLSTQHSALSTAAAAPPLPPPRIDIAIRAGTLDDLPFIDALQKKHSKQLGFMHRAALEGKVARSEVLVAEAGADLAGYLIGSDRYQHRDELGIIYQIGVVPEYRRSLVAASLLKAQFERSAYGCRLYCCWCAQDLESNRFWEAMGFTAIAFRAGSEKKKRVHIFWQKRIRAGDVSTPWWYPCQTRGGAMDAERIALPIPPGVRWSDAMPVILPGTETKSTLLGSTTETAGLPGPEGAMQASPEPRRKRARKPSEAEMIQTARPERMRLVGWGFAPVQPVGEAKAVEEPKPAKKREKKKAKHDPRMVQAARELRDRWSEVAEMRPAESGKYEVARRIEAPEPARAAGLLAA